MRKNRIILVAVGEKGVTYGVSHGKGTCMPRQLLELVATSEAESWTLTRGGAIAYFLESYRVAELLQAFFQRAEALRKSMPLLGVGVAQAVSVGQVNWLGKLKRGFQVDAVTEQRALANIQGAQTYWEILEKIARPYRQ